MTQSTTTPEELVRLAETDQEILACFPAMKQLRPELEEHAFVDNVRKLIDGGYRLAYIAEGGRVVCVAGFRISHNLVLGKNLYVDDLSTLDESRSRGHGTAMMSWLREHALAERCNVLHLDSGVQRHRAHKFYLNQGMAIVSYHFAEKIR